jgi:hypothetical protein
MVNQFDVFGIYFVLYARYDRVLLNPFKGASK